MRLCRKLGSLHDVFTLPNPKTVPKQSQSCPQIGKLDIFIYIYFISRPEESESKTIGGRTRRSSRKSDPPESATVAPSSGAKMSPVPERSLSSPKRDKSPPKSPVKQTPEKAKIPSSPKAKMSSPQSSDKSPSPVVKEKSEKATKKIEEEKSTSSPRSSDKSPSPVVKEKSEKATKKIEEEKSTSPLKDKSPTRSASSTPHRKQKKALEAPEALENKVLEEPLVKEKSEIIGRVTSPRRGEKILSPSAAEKQSPEKADRIRPSRSDKSPTSLMVKPQKPEKANSPSTKTDMNAPAAKQKSDKIRSPSPSMAVSKSEENEDSQEHSLPYGWKKLARRRQQTGQGNKTWDVYIIAPCGKKLRSNPEIEKYLSENPDVQIDRDVTNTSKPSDFNSSRCKIETSAIYNLNHFNFNV